MQHLLNFIGTKYFSNAKNKYLKGNHKKVTKPYKKKNRHNNGKEVEEGGQDESILKLAGNINIIRDDRTTGHKEEDDMEEHSPFDRKIKPNKTTILGSQIEDLNSAQELSIRGNNGFTQSSGNINIVNDKSIFNSANEENDKIRFSYAKNARDSLIRLRDHNQRSTQYKSLVSGSMSLKKKEDDNNRSRNQESHMHNTASKNDIYVINELDMNNSSEENKYFRTVNAP